MQELIEFLQGIFLGKNSDKMKIGLTQFKTETVIEKPKKAAAKSAGTSRPGAPARRRRRYPRPCS